MSGTPNRYKTTYHLLHPLLTHTTHPYSTWYKTRVASFGKGPAQCNRNHSAYRIAGWELVALFHGTTMGVGEHQLTKREARKRWNMVSTHNIV